jgi:hypothetical protein
LFLFQQIKDDQRKTSMKTRKIEGAHGEYLLVQWKAPNKPTLVNAFTKDGGLDRSKQVDLNSFDEYQVGGGALLIVWLMIVLTMIFLFLKTIFNFF